MKFLDAREMCSPLREQMAAAVYSSMYSSHTYDVLAFTSLPAFSTRKTDEGMGTQVQIFLKRAFFDI